MSELFDAVDALIVGQSPLPPPEERVRLRKAHGLSQEQVAKALEVRRPTVVSWESGRTEPRPPQREAYARLLDKLAELYPANTTGPAQDTAVPQTVTGPSAPAPREAEPAKARPLSTGPAPDAAAVTTEQNTSQRPTSASSRTAATTRPSSTSRRPAANKATPKPAPAAADPRFANGPLAVVDVEDGQVSAYCVGGLVLDVSAKSIPALVDWTLSEAKLGAPKLSGPGKDADPLIVLTEAACERYGLPLHLTEEERLSGRLPEGHKVIKQLARADWKLTKRGFGPWARIYRPAQGSERMCVQLCIPSWDALDTRHWAEAGQLPPAELARLLGTYAT
ncbi:helix-turn-helix domain-containing protein, partial [Actinacidiphila soli]|uniref:helix-turn-helix domain-containing protein n=1 Tax=Actinacidiphila soli TaxID=2487275 RepID=UPI0013E3E098